MQNNNQMNRCWQNMRLEEEEKRDGRQGHVEMFEQVCKNSQIYAEMRNQIFV